MALINYEAISTAYSECVCVYVVLVIQNAKRMRRSILSLVAGLDLTHYPPLSHKRHDIRGGGLMDIKCVLLMSPQPFFKHFSLYGQFSAILH